MRDGRINVAIVVSEAAFTARILQRVWTPGLDYPDMTAQRGRSVGSLAGLGQHAPIARPCGLRYTGAGGRHWPGPPGRPAGPGLWPAATVTGSLVAPQWRGPRPVPEVSDATASGRIIPIPAESGFGDPESL